MYQGLYELLGHPVSPEEMKVETTRNMVFEEVAKAIAIYVDEKIKEIYETYEDHYYVAEQIHQLTKKYNMPIIMLEFEGRKLVNISSERGSEHIEEDISNLLESIFENYSE